MASKGALVIRFLGDTRDFDGAAKSVQNQSSKFGALAKKGGMLAAAGFAAAGVAAVKFTKDAADLDKKQREVVTLFGETGPAATKSLGVVRDQVRRLSDEFGVAQETLTGGLYQAISAGVPRDNAFEFMQVASKAAIAGVTDTETAVDGLTSIINAFGLEASEAQAVADSMFTAVKGGKTNFEQLSKSVFNIAPAAAAAKVSFQEVNAGIAALTASGTPTAVATTQMRAALVGLQKPSKDLDKIFQSLGFQNAQVAIETKGLGFALKAAKDASKGNNGELMKLLGSTEAVAAANVIAGTGSKKFAQEMKAQGKAAGSTEAAYKVMAESTSMQFGKLKTQLKNLGIGVGQDLLPVALKLAKFANSTLVPALRSAGDVLKSSLGPAFSAIAKQVAPVVARLSKAFSGLGTSKLAGELAKTGAALAAFGKSLLPPLQAFGSKLMGVLGPGLKEIGGLLQKELLPAFQKFLPVVQPVAKFLIKVLGGAVIGALKGAIQAIKGVVNVIAGVFKLVSALVNGEWGKAWDALKQIASGAMNALIGAIKVFWNVSILGIFRKGGAFLVKGLWVKLWAGLKSLGAKGWAALGKMFAKGAKGLGRLLLKGVKLYGRIWLGLFKSIWKLTRKGLARVVSGMKALPGRVVSALSNLKSKVRDVFANAMRAARDKVVGIGGKIKDKIAGIPGKIGELGPKFAEAGRKLLQKFIDGMKNAAGIITGIAGNVWNAVRGLLNGAISKINAALEFKISLPGPDIHVNPPNIPKLAKGGIVTRPTLAMIGDNPGGREAVIPLSGPDAMGMGGGHVILEIRSSGSAEDDYLVERMRRAIRVRGGDVQVVLGRS